MDTFTSFFVQQFGAASEIQYREWYGSLAKPFFAPPEWLFGAAWGIIYPLIIAAFVWAIILWRKKKIEGSFVGLFVANIVANLAFTPLLLSTLNNTVGTVSILAVVGTLAAPYLAWGSFATILQITITVMN